MIYLNNNTEVQLVSIPRGTVAASSSVTQYATEEYVDNAIEEAISGITGVNYTAGENIQIVNDVISVTGMPDTSEFVTSAEVQTQINDSISGITGGTTYEAGDNIQISGNVISVTGMPDTSEFVTSGDVQTQINDSISGITGGTTYEAGTNIDITNNVISVTGITVPDVSHFVTSGDVQTQIDDSISGKADTTAITGFVTSAEVQTQIDESISGLSPYTAGTYIDITDNIISVTGLTGDSGEKVVELTMAEYTALTSYTEDTTYIITDAPAIDLDNLATTGDLETKADKVTVTANGSWGYLPKWNDQGIITGSSRVYEVSLPINNTTYFMVKSNSTSLPSIYAPTAGGTAGQILQSNGAANAPVWSSFKMWFGTQTQYDAITTKDSSTIYFVKED